MNLDPHLEAFGWNDYPFPKFNKNRFDADRVRGSGTPYAMSLNHCVTGVFNNIEQPTQIGMKVAPKTVGEGETLLAAIKEAGLQPIIMWGIAKSGIGLAFPLQQLMAAYDRIGPIFAFGLTLPFGGIIIPLCFLERTIGIYNTRLAIMLPLIGLYIHFVVYWIRSHFIKIPLVIPEAAHVDRPQPGSCLGISIFHSQRYLSLHWVFFAVWIWNQFHLVLVLVENPTQITMAGALGTFKEHSTTNVPLLCAGTILILMPILVIFLLFQRQIITALINGADKVDQFII